MKNCIKHNQIYLEIYSLDKRNTNLKLYVMGATLYVHVIPQLPFFVSLGLQLHG